MLVRTRAMLVRTRALPTARINPLASESSEGLDEGSASMMWQVTCQCGWRTRGAKDEVVVAVQAHGREAHGLETTEEEVMQLAVPAEDQAGA